MKTIRRCDVPIDRALDLAFGHAVGLDMTRRDLQRAMGDIMGGHIDGLAGIRVKVV